MTADAGRVGHLLAAIRLRLRVHAAPDGCGLCLAGHDEGHARSPEQSCRRNEARARHLPHDAPTIWSDWTLTRISAPRRTMYPVTRTLWPLCGSGL